MELNLTKATKIFWGDSGEKDGSSNIEFTIERLEKLHNMVVRNLTDGIVYDDNINEPTVGVRYWTTIEAAEEWLEFIKNLATRYNKRIVSMDVVDIN